MSVKRCQAVSPSFSGCVFCPQVVYSSSARELKMETVKPDTPEKEEDDIDIDAIWESSLKEEDDAFLVLWLWLTMPSTT